MAGITSGQENAVDSKSVHKNDLFDLLSASNFANRPELDPKLLKYVIQKTEGQLGPLERRTLYAESICELVNFLERNDGVADLGEVKQRINSKLSANIENTCSVAVMLKIIDRLEDDKISLKAECPYRRS